MAWFDDYEAAAARGSRPRGGELPLLAEGDRVGYVDNTGTTRVYVVGEDGGLVDPVRAVSRVDAVLAWLNRGRQ